MKQNELIKNRLASSFGSAFAGGKLKIYAGVMPAIDAIISNTLLCEIVLPSPAFTVIPVDGVVSKAGTWEGTAVGTGTATWAKLQSASLTQFVFITVGESAAEAIINNDAITIGDTVTVNSIEYTVPEE